MQIESNAENLNKSFLHYCQSAVSMYVSERPQKLFLLRQVWLHTIVILENAVCAFMI